MTQVKELVDKYNILHAQKNSDKLTKACPVAQVNTDFSPEKISKMAEKNPIELIKNPMIWECLACGLCKEVSNNTVNMSLFIKDVRVLASENGSTGTKTHDGILLTAQRMNSPADFSANRTGWIDDSLTVDFIKGDYLFWAGGASFFNAVMPELADGAIHSARSAIQLFNHLGITPVVLRNQHFSGHDLLWTGDVSNFKKLAEQNIQAIKNTGAKKIVVSSPEDYYTLSTSYPEMFGDLGCEVSHITEFLSDNLLKLKFKKLEKVVTYHDPCHLGRGMGIYEAPRAIINAIPGLELVEMKNSKELSLCCGTSCWTNCNKFSKLMQVNRIREAANTGAKTLITTCWECAIHFNCAMRSSAWQQEHIKTEDLTVLAASLLQD